MKQRPGLILVSHGSLLCGADKAVNEHAARLRKSGDFHSVRIGFLNYSNPSFGEALAAIMVEGATEVILVPYFLVPGRFARAVISDALAHYSNIAAGIVIRIANPIGYEPLLVEAVLQLVESTGDTESRTSAISESLLACATNPKCPLVGLSGCKARSEDAAQ